jgi:hypothetical protein
MTQFGSIAAALGAALIVWAFLGERSTVLLERSIDLGRANAVMDTVILAGPSEYLAQIGVEGAAPDACVWGGNLAAGTSCAATAAPLVFDWRVTVGGRVAAEGSNESAPLGTFAGEGESGVVLGLVRGEPGEVAVVQVDVRRGAPELAGRAATVRMLLGPAGTDRMLTRGAMRLGGGAILAMFGLLLVASGRRRKMSA